MKFRCEGVSLSVNIFMSNYVYIFSSTTHTLNITSSYFVGVLEGERGAALCLRFRAVDDDGAIDEDGEKATAGEAHDALNQPRHGAATCEREAFNGETVVHTVPQLEQEHAYAHLKNRRNIAAM